MKTIQVYADSSVFGGVFDDEFAEPSVAFFDLVRAGRFILDFKHIVHFEKIRLYNAVNALHGYETVEIRSPLEVLDYEEEEI